MQKETHDIFTITLNLVEYTVYGYNDQCMLTYKCHYGLFERIIITRVIINDSPVWIDYEKNKATRLSIKLGAAIEAHYA